MRRILFGIFMLAVLSAEIPDARGDGCEYSNGVLTPINVPGASSTLPSGINGAGVIVGSYCNIYGCQNYLDNGGVFATINAPGAPTGINDAGQIVGIYCNNGCGSYLDNGGALTPINVPGAFTTSATGINDLGQIVGYYCNPITSGLSTFENCQGFLDKGGVFTAIKVPGATAGTYITGINDSGQIVGLYGASSENLGFVDNGGTFTTIDVPGSTFINPTGINDAGEIVGSYGVVGGGAVFVYNGGVLTSINLPGAQVGAVPTGIDDAGDIIGFYTPIISTPEPGTLALLGTGLIGLARMILRSR